MKKYLLVCPLVVLLCIVVGCQDKAAMAELEKYKAQAAAEEQNMAIAIRYLDAWAKADIAALKQICSPDYVEYDESGRMSSLEKMTEVLAKQRTSVSDIAMSYKDSFAKGDKVVVRYIFKCTVTEDIQGMPTAGKKIENSGIDIVRIQNGKIIENWDVSDQLGFLDELGYVMTPAVEKKK
jgi:steroid delta-isomerase-like uncharacterized protein